MDVRKTGAKNPASSTVASTNARGAEKAKTSSSKSADGVLQNQNASQVNVSTRAQMMNKTKEVATNAQVNNDAKIARLQKLIDEGNYKVDAEAVADRLVDSHLAYPE